MMVSGLNPIGGVLPTLPREWLPPAARATEPQPGGAPTPNRLVRWAFYFSLFAVPFVRLYLPGTGDRIGVTRLVQGLILGAVVSQPRVCLRLVPLALCWFLAYCGFRVLAGICLTPELSSVWWPNTLEWLQFSLPWAWVMFNVLQFPRLGRAGLWALVTGCSLCALLHVAGIGVVEVDYGTDARTSLFGENANVLGATYAVALIVLTSLTMRQDLRPISRLAPLPLILLVGLAMAKTGSRTALLMFAVGITVLLFQSGAPGSRAKRAAALLLIAALLGAVLAQAPTTVQRLEKVNASNLSQQEGRVRMMPVLWEMFLRSPIYGSGPSGYRFELTRRAMPYLIRQQRLIAAHNLVLLLLVETGLIGFALFAGGVRTALVSAWRARVDPRGPLPLALLLSLTIAGIIVSDPSHHLVFWVAIAYALAGAA